MGPVWLTDAQFLKIAPHLPTDTRGKARVDDRRVISGIVHVLKSGSRWVDAPADYGPKKTLYNRFVRWADKGDWTNLFRALAQAYALLSRRPARSCSSSRPTVPTSIRSRTLAKLKALLRKAAARTIKGLWAKIAQLLPAFSPSECANYFAAAGYDPT